CCGSAAINSSIMVAATCDAVTCCAVVCVAASANCANFSHVVWSRTIDRHTPRPPDPSAGLMRATAAASCSKPSGPCGVATANGTTRLACNACWICFSESIGYFSTYTEQSSQYLENLIYTVSGLAKPITPIT